MEEEESDEYSGRRRASRKAMGIWSERTVEPKDLMVLSWCKVGRASLE